MKAAGLLTVMFDVWEMGVMDTKISMETGHDGDMTAIGHMRDRLVEAARLYYQGAGDSGMTDEEYDAGIAYLKTMHEKYDLSSDAVIMGLIGGEVAAGTTVDDNAPKVRHDVPMLSLAKANNRDEVKAYIMRMVAAGATGFRMQAKFDGIALSAVYHDGALVQLSTRGNGIEGESLDYLLGSSTVTIKGLPRHLEGGLSHTDVEVRGELFLRPSEFRDINERRKAKGEEPFSNPRNTNAGIVKKAASGDADDAVLQFVMYRVLGDVDVDKLMESGMEEATVLTEREWKATGEPIPHGGLTCGLVMGTDGKVEADATVDTVMDVVDAFDAVRGRTDLSLDGIVIKPLNEASMDKELGSTAHHPRSQLAYKYPGATGVTKVRGVTVTVGKSGRVTPTAVLDPVEVDGVTISRATLHNYDWVGLKGVAIGSTVVVERRHDVIPAIRDVVFTPVDAEPITVPAQCPYCGASIVDGCCPNVGCPSRGAYMLKAAAGKNGLDFDGMGPKVIEALYDSGLVRDVADFYDLTVEGLADVVVGSNADGSVRRFGLKRAGHVMEYIQRSLGVPYHRVLASLSIPDVGVRTAKALVAQYPSIDGLRSASIDELAGVDGVGVVTARKIKSGLEAQWPVVERLRAHGLQFVEAPAGTGTGSGLDDGGGTVSMARKALENVRISITGKVPDGYANREAWCEYVDSMGGVAQSSPRRDTDYLVWDGVRSSSKLVKARENGVKVISPVDFLNALRTGSLPDRSTYDDSGNHIG